MASTELEWALFLASGRPPAERVTRLPADLCRIIGSSSPIVRIRHDYALKIAQKHNLESKNFPLLPIVIDQGRVISDQPRRLSFFFFERVIEERWFQATIKSNEQGTELWLVTFHQVWEKEVHRMCKRCPILRTDDVWEADKK